MLDRLERAAGRERRLRGRREPRAAHDRSRSCKAEIEVALLGPLPSRSCARRSRSAARRADRLVRLAEDLLVLARADEGVLPVRPERLDAAELLAGTARRFEARAERETGRELRVVDASTGLALHADRLRAEQALANLVDNALRHGDGTVELHAEQAGDGVRLHVLDRGPGFDPALNGHAFERFTRGDRARSRGGTGLGLAIVDAIARSHGRQRRGGAARGRRRGRLDRAAGVSF